MYLYEVQTPSLQSVYLVLAATIIPTSNPMTIWARMDVSIVRSTAGSGKNMVKFNGICKTYTISKQ